MDRRVHELREAFFQVLDRPGDRAERWLDVWRLFVGHPWYQAELHHAARRLLWRTHAPRELFEDIEHEAMLYFAKDLRNAPDLHVDRTLFAERFSGFLARIIARDCLKALRALRRQERNETSFPRGYDPPARAANLEIALDLSAAIEELPAALRPVVALYRQGWPLNEIAARLDISYWQANRALRAGLGCLTSAL